MTRKVLIAALALACAVFTLGFPLAAFAAEVVASGTKVLLPLGDWLTSGLHALAEAAVPTLVTLIGAGLVRLFPALSLFISNAFIDRMVRLAMDYALNAVAGAAKGRVLPVEVGAAVVAVGVERAINSTVPWVVARAGGAQGIAERLFRALALEPEASRASVLDPALDRLGVSSGAGA